eukprot:TRINITY_DN105273_c3_g1_i1.p18 TRINITY_DN105273_c3_g1~~TRINITY_DN105273_c3_g1_i1.p18  ORF type:complete len:177 (+),score=14.46 TRINITY_DN105273_c3_g1_i1:1138-1668(+)
MSPQDGIGLLNCSYPARNTPKLVSFMRLSEQQWMYGLLDAFLQKCLVGNLRSLELIVRIQQVLIQKDINQLGLVLDMLGSPTQDEIDSFPNAQTRDFLRSLEKRKPRPLDTLFKGANPLAIDLLSKLLKFDANKRITIEEALAHPYLKELHYPSDEVFCFMGTYITIADRESGNNV